MSQPWRQAVAGRPAAAAAAARVQRAMRPPPVPPWSGHINHTVRDAGTTPCERQTTKLLRDYPPEAARKAGRSARDPPGPSDNEAMVRRTGRHMAQPRAQGPWLQPLPSTRQLHHPLPHLVAFRTVTTRTKTGSGSPSSIHSTSGCWQCLLGTSAPRLAGVCWEYPHHS